MEQQVAKVKTMSFRMRECFAWLHAEPQAPSQPSRCGTCRDPSLRLQHPLLSETLAVCVLGPHIIQLS